MDYKRIFAEKIKSCRKLRNLTQEQLAERAGLSYKHLGEIERQEVNPTLKAMGKIARALEVDLSELLIPPGKEAKVLLNPIGTQSQSELKIINEAIRILGRVFRFSS